MSTADSESTFRIFPALAILVGGILAVLGLLFVQSSLFGGLHVAAIGASVFLLGMISTRWAAARWTMSAADQHRWSVAFGALAGLLVILFVLVNYASFEGPITIEEGSSEGGS